MLVAETPWCCPVAALLDYSRRTRDVRRTASEDGKPLTFLFIGSERDGRAECVGQECLSKHTLQWLRQAGLQDVKSKDIRSIAATTARDFNVQLRTVLQRGRWRREKTFRLHYDRPDRTWTTPALNDLPWRSADDLSAPLCFSRLLPWAAAMEEVFQLRLRTPRAGDTRDTEAGRGEEGARSPTSPNQAL